MAAIQAYSACMWVCLHTLFLWTSSSVIPVYIYIFSHLNGTWWFLTALEHLPLLFPVCGFSLFRFFFFVLMKKIDAKEENIIRLKLGDNSLVHKSMSLLLNIVRMMSQRTYLSISKVHLYAHLKVNQPTNTTSWMRSTYLGNILFFRHQCHSSNRWCDGEMTRPLCIPYLLPLPGQGV